LKFKSLLDVSSDGNAVFGVATNSANANEKAVVIVNNTALNEQTLKSVLDINAPEHSQIVHSNDRFSKLKFVLFEFLLYFSSNICIVIRVSLAREMFVSLIQPANQSDIDKYTAQKRDMIHETIEMHVAVTRPFIDEQRSVTWIEKIIDGHAEQDSILERNE
jgi:hypothetical protein